MSCRIERLVTGEDLVVLSISGRLTAGDLDMLKDLIGQERGTVALDLKDLYFVDRDAVKVLAFSEASGVELKNCPAYIQEWVARESAQTASNESESS